MKMTRNHRRALCFAVRRSCVYTRRSPSPRLLRGFDNGFIGAASIVLMVAALGGFVVAGWAVVWVPRERSRIKIQSRPAAHLTGIGHAKRSAPGPLMGTINRTIGGMTVRSKFLVWMRKFGHQAVWLWR